jgi:nucleoside-diphosphate-sugar epimerase
MRVVVIGGTGHIGTYLTPRLVHAGHQVTSVSRRRRAPYRDDTAWTHVTQVEMDREVAESRGNFGEQIAALQPEVVVDLICYTPESARQLVEGLRGRVKHLLHCGTIWVHGPGVEVPTTEQEPRRAFGEYGCRKSAIEAYLFEQVDEVPVTVLHPGHLVGPGWPPVNPAGNFNTDVFSALASGREVLLPNFGLETLHHVHVDDVAQAFAAAIEHRSAALGQSFHVVSPAALTLRGYAERMAEWFGRAPVLRFQSWEDWRQGVSVKDAAVTLDHIRHSSHCSIEKARSLLDYRPGYRSLEAIQESVAWLMQNGVVRQH